jgi:hypothetical protein
MQAFGRANSGRRPSFSMSARGRSTRERRISSLYGAVHRAAAGAPARLTTTSDPSHLLAAEVASRSLPSMTVSPRWRRWAARWRPMKPEAPQNGNPEGSSGHDAIQTAMTTCCVLPLAARPQPVSPGISPAAARPSPAVRNRISANGSPTLSTIRAARQQSDGPRPCAYGRQFSFA